ncbi:MAG TPA: response regulator, partial [Verrucomicrobiae bacterium]|nr:response regulator [Verrucomicrobiae bacterium]
KEIGRGTGLGLATVYGIVKQHEGWIEVASDLGHGSSFSIYLPASKEIASQSKKQFETAVRVKGGNETILFVEDEPPLRDMTYAILRDCGYNVLVAASAIEALPLWNNHGSNVDLLLADIILPEGMSGVELASRLLSYRPELRVLFTSGYSMGGMDTSFLLKCRGDFLQKPYTRFTLARAVRDCLDKSAAAQSPVTA